MTFRLDVKNVFYYGTWFLLDWRWPICALMVYWQWNIFSTVNCWQWHIFKANCWYFSRETQYYFVKAVRLFALLSAQIPMSSQSEKTYNVQVCFISMTGRFLSMINTQLFKMSVTFGIFPGKCTGMQNFYMEFLWGNYSFLQNKSVVNARV